MSETPENLSNVLEISDITAVFKTIGYDLTGIERSGKDIGMLFSFESFDGIETNVNIMIENNEGLNTYSGRIFTRTKDGICVIQKEFPNTSDSNTLIKQIKTCLISSNRIGN